MSWTAAGAACSWRGPVISPVRSESAGEEGNAVQRLEHAYPGSVFVVVPHFVFPDVLAARRPEVHALEARLASWEAPALARVAETWLGQTDALLYFSDVARVINRMEPRR